MLYSCFNAASAEYDYFEDDTKVAINADLPVPRLPKPTPLGVASIQAARPMPAGARYVGSGWAARGVVVSCERRGGKGLGDDSLASSLGVSDTTLYVGLGLLAGLGLYLALR